MNTCGLCGRVHFATGDNHAGYDKGELEDLRQKAKAEPDKYIEDTISSGISCGELRPGGIVVWGCKCRRIEKYQQFILGNRDAIIRFLKAHFDAQKKQAEQTIGDVEKLQ